MKWSLVIFLMDIISKYLFTSQNKIFLSDEQNNKVYRSAKNRLLNKFQNFSVTEKAILNKFSFIDNSILFHFPNSSNASQIVSYDLLINSHNTTMIQQNVCYDDYTYNLVSIQNILLVAFTNNQSSCLSLSVIESNNMIIFSFPNLRQVITIFSVFKLILIKLTNYTSINVIDSLYINNTNYQILVVFTKAYDQSK